MQGGSFPVLCFVALHAEFAQLVNKDEKDLILNENTTRVIDSLSQNSNRLALWDPGARDAEPWAEGLPQTGPEGEWSGRTQPRRPGTK